MTHAHSARQGGHIRPSLISFGRVQVRVAWAMPEHLHPWHELVLIVAGTYRARIGQRNVVAGPGTTVYLPRGIVHSSHSNSDIEYYLVQFEPAPEDWPGHQTPCVRADRGRLADLMQMVEEIWPPAGPRQQMLLSSMLDVMLYEYDCALREEENELVRMVRTFVRDRLDQRITLPDLARAAGLSKYHFVRRFAKVAGVSPMRFVRRLQAEAARVLLSSTSLPHKAIAQETGLRDEAELYRLFTRIYGKPPSAFRISGESPRHWRHPGQKPQ